MKLLRLIFPNGWNDVVVRALKVALVVFIVLQLKEWIEIGEFDTAAAVSDAMFIATGTLVLNGILRLARA